MGKAEFVADHCVPEVIEMLAPSHLLIVWSDGLESLYSHRQLRLSCSCASCVDEWTRKPILNPQKVAEQVKLVAIEATGSYGLLLTFSDGHSTGIYTFVALRELDQAADLSAGGN